MKALRRDSFACLASVGVVAGLTVAAPAQTPKEIPTPPAAPPSSLPFADELAGRRLLFAARDAYREAPALRFLARWTATTDLGARKETITGTETVAAEPAARRLALTTETVRGGDKQIRRAIANGSALLATRFHAPAGGKEPTREYMRVLLTPENTLSGALRQVQAAPASRAGALLLDPEWTVRGVTWRGKEQTLNGAPADEVWVTEAARPQEYEGKIRALVTTRRRYLLHPRTHHLLRYEEWASAEAQGAAARDAKREYPRTAYRREDYQNTAVSEASLPPALFGQSLPQGYKETALPSVDLPPTGDLLADAPAQRLLHRWLRAQERLLSYFGQIEVTTRRENESAAASAATIAAARRPQPSLIYNLWLYNPGRVRLTLETTGMPERQTRSLLAVADGRQVWVQDRRRSDQVRRVPVTDPSETAARLERAGFLDWGGTLRWLFAPPIQDYDRAVYRGRESLQGETVEVLELVQAETDRRGRRRSGEERVTIRVALGADNLPRQIERRRERMENGQNTVIDRIVTARFRQVRVDEEPPRGTFTFEPPAGATADGQDRASPRGE